MITLVIIIGLFIVAILIDTFSNTLPPATSNSTDKVPSTGIPEYEKLKKILEQHTTTKAPKYANKKQYMCSKEWYEKKTSRKVIDGYQCQMCGTSNNLVVHHISYQRLYNENINDIVTVCRSCHQAIHNIYGYVGPSFPLLPKTSNIIKDTNESTNTTRNTKSL